MKPRKNNLPPSPTWDEDIRRDTYGPGVDALEARVQETLGRIANDKKRDLEMYRSGIKPIRGVADAVIQDRENRGFTPYGEDIPVLSSNEIIQAIAKRIWRPPIDGESMTPMKQQDSSWAGHHAREVVHKGSDGKKHVVANHLRPTNLREKVSNRRLNHAYNRYKTYVLRAQDLKDRFGVKKPSDDLEIRRVEEHYKTPIRKPKYKQSLVERYKQTKNDFRVWLNESLAKRKQRKFKRIAKGHWWAV